MLKDFEHQTRVVEESWNKEGWNLFCDTGTGKSRVAIKTAERLYSKGLIDSLLIVAPAGCYRNWEEQWKIHSGLTATMNIWSSALTSAARARLGVTACAQSPNMQVLLINVEALSNPAGAATTLARGFLQSHKALMVIDESTKIRKPTSSRTKVVLSLGTLAKYRRNLSGFPAPERPVDLYTQCLFIRPPTSLFPFKSYYSFRNTFCIVENDTIYVSGGQLRRIARITGAQRQSELREILLNFSSLVSKKECLDLPPKIYQRREIPFSKEQAALYETAQKKALYEITAIGSTTASAAMNDISTLAPAPTVSVSNRMAQLEKLHQIASGIVKDSEGNWHHIPTGIYDELLDLLEEINGKVVIYSCYSEQIAEAVRRLGAHFGPQSVAAFDGGTAQADRARIVRDYEDPASPLRYLVANQATGQFGWTLVAGSTAIYLSNNHEVEPRHQSEDRLHRIGQVGASVTYIDFITGSLSEKILNNVMAKRNIAAEIMGPGWQEELYGRL